MDENYLAKSVYKEDIQTHTNNLLRNFEKLKNLYPNIKVNWSLLYNACLYHDLGKMNLKFQSRIHGKKCSGEIPHGVLSLAFINYKRLKKIYGYRRNDIKILFHSIAYHHDRNFNFEIEDVEEEIGNMKEQFKDFHYDKLGEDKFLADTIEDSYFIKNDRIYDTEESFYNYIMVKGLLNRLDYAASAYIDVENKNDFLQPSLNNLVKRWQKKDTKAKWNDLQEYMIKSRNENVIVIAQTGMGKTEAGLLWLGEDKGFFTLPLKSAINSIYNRIRENIVTENIENRVGMLHSETYSKYIEIQEKNDNKDEIDLENYYTKTKQLSLPLTICTLDQIFDFVYRYRGFEPKLATLSYSKIIIDEIQMYSSDLLAYLVLGLSYISKLGGKFAILTATLPNIVVDLLKSENIQFKKIKVFINGRIRHSIKIEDKEINLVDIIKKYKNNKILVICNTVKTATKIYKELVEKINDSEVNLLHGNFIKKDRDIKENEIQTMGDKNNKSHGIWVATQIVEASLDIDFDLLFTELSDLNGLFQRMGRCYRDRDLDVDYNCFVYTGGQKGCSGVGKFIDKDIFEFSKEAIKNIDGVINEKTKVELVSNLYTKEKLCKTQYYTDIIENIKYVKSIECYELDKAEMQKRFRNIDSITVMPKQVYEGNIEIIKNNINILNKPFDKSMSEKERKSLKIEKIKSRNNIMEFTVSLYGHIVRNAESEILKLNKYEQIPILECDYNDKVGVENIVRKNNKADFSDFSF